MTTTPPLRPRLAYVPRYVGSQVVSGTNKASHNLLQPVTVQLLFLDHQTVAVTVQLNKAIREMCGSCSVFSVTRVTTWLNANVTQTTPERSPNAPCHVVPFVDLSRKRGANCLVCSIVSDRPEADASSGGSSHTKLVQGHRTQGWEILQTKPV